MREQEIRDLAQRFGIIGLFLSKRHLDLLFAFVREVEKKANEAQGLKSIAQRDQESAAAQNAHARELVEEFQRRSK